MAPLLEFLKTEMPARIWNVSRLAAVCDADVALASRWLAEDKKRSVTPGPKSCEKIAAALGIDADLILELAGHRKPKSQSARVLVDARRQAKRDELDCWLAAVEPEYEDYLWAAARAHFTSTVQLIEQLRTPVSAGGDAAVDRALGGRGARGRRHLGTAGGG